MPCCATPRRAMPCHATPAAHSARTEGCARLWLLPHGSCVSCPSPVLPRLISCDPAQGARTTSGLGPCKQLSHVPCQLFAYNGRAVLRLSLEGLCEATRSLPATAGSCRRDTGLRPSLRPAHGIGTPLSCQGHTAQLMAPAGCAQLRDQCHARPPTPLAPLWSLGRARAGGRAGRHQHGDWTGEASAELAAGLSAMCCSQRRPGKPLHCQTGVCFTAFTTKQDLFQIFFKICLEIVFYNIEIGLIFF